jgi:hypothetical protein
MSIRAFSAQRFYSIATGAPIDRSDCFVSLNSDLPSRGLHVIEPNEQGETDLLWIGGVVASSKRRERFIQQIRNGEIPTPLPASESEASSPRIRYHSLDALQNRGQTVAALLGLPTELVRAARHSVWARCPSCSEDLPVFPTAAAMCDHISRSLAGKEITIELVGASEEVSTWATARGFTPTSAPHDRGAARLDSLRCERGTLRALEPLLTSTRHLPTTWLTIRSECGVEEYGWNGRCARCDITLSPFTTTAARDYIERGSSPRFSHEGARLVDGVTLSELITSPLTKVLPRQTLTAAFTPLQLEMIPLLSLQSVTLHTRTTELSPRALAALVAVALADESKNGEELRIFQASAALFSSGARSEIERIANALSQHGGFIWLTERPHDTHKPVDVEAPTEKRRSLGSLTLTFPELITRQIALGAWSEVEIPPALQHLNVGSHVDRALGGKNTELVRCEAQAPFTPHLIPLFDVESTTTRLVAHALGVMEPLAKMFAASHQARMLGLAPRDLLLGQLRHSHSICGSCKGLGVLLTRENDYAHASPCHSCWGTRFKTPAREITFKGKTMGEILNAPLSASENTLRALPRMKEVFELVTLLSLADLPLGMPVTLLSGPQRRLLSIAHALLVSTKTRPSVIVLEEPEVGFSERQREALVSVIQLPAFHERSGWVGVCGGY